MNVQRPNLLPQLDELNRLLLIAGISSSLVGMFFQYGTALRYVCTAISAACLIFAAIRIFGGNPSRRSRENLKYLTILTAVETFFRNLFKKHDPSTPREKKAKKVRKNPTWSEIRQYKYFICPQCAQRLRVPRGKGRLRVTCTCCGNKFEVKS